MRECGRDLHLPFESRDRDGIAVLTGANEFHRAGPTEKLVLGQVHFPPASRAKSLGEYVLAEFARRECVLLCDVDSMRAVDRQCREEAEELRFHREEGEHERRCDAVAHEERDVRQQRGHSDQAHRPCAPLPRVGDEHAVLHHDRRPRERRRHREMPRESWEVGQELAQCEREGQREEQHHGAEGNPLHRAEAREAEPPVRGEHDRHESADEHHEHHDSVVRRRGKQFGGRIHEAAPAHGEPHHEQQQDADSGQYGHESQAPAKHFLELAREAYRGRSPGSAARRRRPTQELTGRRAAARRLLRRLRTACGDGTHAPQYAAPDRRRRRAAGRLRSGCCALRIRRSRNPQSSGIVASALGVSY